MNIAEKGYSYMTINIQRWIGMAALCCLLFAAVGCTKNNGVKLSYALGQPQTSCVGEVIVFKFADKRTRTRLGTDNAGAAIHSLSDVADWVGWALFDELKATGCDPRYRTSTVTPGQTPLVTGEVLDVSLNQTGTTTYSARISVRVVLERPGTPAYAEKYSSEVEDVVLPGYASESDVMAEALRLLMAEIVPSIAAKL